MKMYKAVVIGLVSVAGFVVLRSWGERRTDIVVTSEPPKPAALEPHLQPSATPAPATPLTPTPPTPAPTATANTQSDETAGKTVDVTELGTSPKDMSSPYLGAKDAPVIVNIFSDFQCPVCKRSADPIKQLVHRFSG